MFKPNARILKQRYLDEAHEFFEKRGPFAIVLARFVPIVRTLAPITAGAARMRYGVFTLYNVLGAVVWGVGLMLLGYWLGQFEIDPEAARADLHPHRAGLCHSDVHRVVQAATEGRGLRQGVTGSLHQRRELLPERQSREQLAQAGQRVRGQEQIAVRQRRRHRTGQRLRNRGARHAD